MSFFKDVSNFASNTRLGGWSLANPNEYSFSYQSSRYGYYNKAKFTVDTNFKNSFKLKFSLRF